MDNRPARRIVLTGPECTGKSTLAARIAAETGSVLVLESARGYAEDVKRPLTVDDVEPIARRAIATEDAIVATKPTGLVFDTDLLSTVVYGRHYYGFRSEFIEREARARRADLYLLCRPDIPWEPDGIRDSPGNREEMLELFRTVLAEFGARVTEIGGLGDARFASALKASSEPQRRGV
jgi:nicotinamide riboside kinase